VHHDVAGLAAATAVPPPGGAGPVAVLGPLVDWLPQSAQWVAVLAGPLVLLGYLVGSIPFGALVARRRFRRQLRRPDAHLERPSVDRSDLLAGALTVAATLAVTTVAWDVALAATPGTGYFSAVGTYANQVIGAWVSVALWTGMGVVVGHMGSVFQRFRGGTGLPPAVALAFAYAPLVFSAAAAVFLAAYALTKQVRLSLLVALPAAVVAEYLLWIADVQEGWGVTNGPELALWTTVLVTALFAGNLRPGATATGD
jgi:acyl phosphate:glycerol-3-phosphate acyltransferase